MLLLTIATSQLVAAQQIYHNLLIQTPFTQTFFNLHFNDIY